MAAEELEELADGVVDEVGAKGDGGVSAGVKCDLRNDSPMCVDCGQPDRCKIRRVVLRELSVECAQAENNVILSRAFG